MVRGGGNRRAHIRARLTIGAGPHFQQLFNVVFLVIRYHQLCDHLSALWSSFIPLLFGILFNVGQNPFGNRFFSLYEIFQFTFVAGSDLVKPSFAVTVIIDETGIGGRRGVTKRH